MPQAQLKIASASFVGLAMTVWYVVTARPCAFNKAEAVFDWWAGRAGK
jgi:hypothetical protein